jgi:ABC-type Fe3+/spermidine/putrescine transport system ATPase subunit
VLVTHDQTEALSMSDRIAVMSAGRIIEIGTPDQVYFRPGSSITARQIGGANVLEGDCVAEGGAWMVNTALGRLQAAAGVAGRVRVMIRPENIMVGGDGRDGGVNRVRCRVRITRFAGQLSELELIPEASPELRLRARVPSGGTMDTGTPISVTIDPAFVHVLAMGA